MSPWCSLRIFRLTVSPSPVPREPFVDTKRLKICDRVSGDIPSPLSLTVIRVRRLRESAVTRISTRASGRPSTASRALVTTLRTAREIPSGSKSIRGRSAGGLQRIVVPASAARWWTVSTMSATNATRSVGSGSGSRSLLKESMSMTSDEILF